MRLSPDVDYPTEQGKTVTILCLKLPDDMALMLIRAFTPLGHAVLVSQADDTDGLAYDLVVQASADGVKSIRVNDLALPPAVSQSDPALVAAVALALANRERPAVTVTPPMGAVPIESEDLRMDYARQFVQLGGADLGLKGREFDLLFVLGERMGQVVSRQELMELLWPDISIDSKTLDIHVSRLRRRLGVHASRLVTRRNRGYMFTAPT